MIYKILKITTKRALKHKGLTFINIFGLSVAMAFCILILLFVQYELSFDNHYNSSERIFRITTDFDMAGSIDKMARTPANAGIEFMNAIPEVESFTRVKNVSGETDFIVEYNTEKIEDNGLHDSTIIKCPIRKEEIEENYTYQKLVNNKVDEIYLEELRIPIINYKMIIILIKYRFHTDQFDQEANQKAEIKFPKHIFNETEIKKIESFCEKMNFEVGEIDILRDQDNKMIYIVDTNNTPSFAGDGYNRSGKNKIIKILSKEFHNQYIKNI